MTLWSVTFFEYVRCIQCLNSIQRIKVPSVNYVTIRLDRGITC